MPATCFRALPAYSAPPVFDPTPPAISSSDHSLAQPSATPHTSQPTSPPPPDGCSSSRSLPVSSLPARSPSSSTLPRTLASCYALQPLFPAHPSKYSWLSPRNGKSYKVCSQLVHLGKLTIFSK